MTRTSPPPLKPERFHVYLSDPDGDPEAEPEAHTVTVIWADQLRGELEGAKRGISSKRPMHLATLWVWAALVRTGATTDRYDTFVPRVLAIVDDKGEASTADDDQLDELGPTVTPDRPSGFASD